MSKIYLPAPSMKREVQQTLNFHVAGSMQELHQKSIFWTFTHWFLQGMRNFRLRSLTGGGSPSLTFSDNKGRKRVRFEQALVDFSVEMGRIQGIDLSPMVVRKRGLGLGGIRDESVSQALLDHLWSIWNSPAFKTNKAYMLAAYGTSAQILLPPQAKHKHRWEPELRLIAPWEILPMPSGAVGNDQTGMIGWKQYVALDWLKENFKNLGKLPSKDNPDLETIQAAYGAKLHTTDAPTVNYPGAYGIGPVSYTDVQRPANSNLESGTEYVELRQFWTVNDDYTTDRYILQLGMMKPTIDIDYTSDEWQDKLQGTLPICPLTVDRYREVGSFWGRGFADVIIPIYREVEYLFADYVANLRDADRLRALAIPNSMDMNLTSLDGLVRNKILAWSPDPNAPSAHPEILSPPNTGDGLGKAIGLMAQMGQALTGQGPLLQGEAPGRVEGGPGLAIVAEAQNTGLVSLGESLNASMTGIYKAALGYTRHMQDLNQKLDLGIQFSIQLHRMDSLPLGLKLDQESGEISVTDLRLPDPRLIQTSIRAKSPRSKTSVLAALNEMHQAHRITTTDWRIAVELEGLDLPLVDRTDFVNYETAKLEVLVLYGDGETPGKITTHPETENHVIHYMVIAEVCASTAYRAASKAVRRKLLSHKQYHESQLGLLGNPPDQGQTVDRLGNISDINPQLAGLLGGAPLGLGTQVPGQ